MRGMACQSLSSLAPGVNGRHWLARLLAEVKAKSSGFLMEQRPVLQLCRRRAQHVPDTPIHRARHFRIGATEHHRLGIVEYFSLLAPGPICRVLRQVLAQVWWLALYTVTLHCSSRLLFFQCVTGVATNLFPGQSEHKALLQLGKGPSSIPELWPAASTCDGMLSSRLVGVAKESLALGVTASGPGNRHC